MAQTESMRIVHVANYYGPASGGVRTTMHALGHGYRAAGHEFAMIVPGREPGVEETPYGRRITVPGIRLGHTGYRVVIDADRVRREITALAPHRLEVSDRTTLRRLGAWARGRGAPTVLIAHERIDDWIGQLLTGRAGRHPAFAPIADRMNGTSLREYDRVVCTTDYAAEQFDRISTASTVRIPLGVDLATFRPGRRSDELRSELLGDGELLLVHAGRLSPEKTPRVAIEALRELRARGVDARLVVAGEGPSRRGLERDAAGLPVLFTGFIADRSELATLLASSDVALSPGPIETFCLSALEALASGTPVVAAATSAVGEILDADSGLAVAPNAAEFADAVLALHADLATRRAAARRRAETFPWSRTVDAMLALHRELEGSPAGLI